MSTPESFPTVLGELVPAYWPSWTAVAAAVGSTTRTLHNWRAGHAVPGLLAFERLRLAVDHHPGVDDDLAERLMAAWSRAAGRRWHPVNA